MPDLPLDEDDATRALAIFNKLKLPDVPGTPTMLSAAGEWIKDIVKALFGSFIDGVRYIKDVFCLVPKKNSKTTGGAGIMITAVLVNKRPMAEFLLIAPTQEIADLAFKQAVGMIEADEDLQKRFAIQHHIKQITDRVTKAFLKIKTFAANVLTGCKPSGVLLDEVHLLSNVAYAASVITQIRGGILARPEGFFLMITTQSDSPPAGVFKSELMVARQVRDGTLKGAGARVLPVLYEFPEEMQISKNKEWLDPKNWHMVLPNLGRSISIEDLTSLYETEKAKGDEALRVWASQHLNIQIGMALQNDGWVGSRYWDGAKDQSLTIEALKQRCDVVVAGVDGGGLDDLFGLCLAGRCKVTRDWLFVYRAWCQEHVLETRKEIASRLLDFESDGTLTICRGDSRSRDFAEAAALIAEFNDLGLLPDKNAVGLDAVGVAEFVDHLHSFGLSQDQTVAVAQGYKMSSAIWGFERKLKDGTLWHDGSAMMDWVLGNCKVEQRGNAVLITKQVSGKAKIDPKMAGFNAFVLLAAHPEAQGRSVYQERGALVL